MGNGNEMCKRNRNSNWWNNRTNVIGIYGLYEIRKWKITTKINNESEQDNESEQNNESDQDNESDQESEQESESVFHEKVAGLPSKNRNRIEEYYIQKDTRSSSMYRVLLYKGNVK